MYSATCGTKKSEVSSAAAFTVNQKAWESVSVPPPLSPHTGQDGPLGARLQGEAVDALEHLLEVLDDLHGRQWHGRRGRI